MPKIDRQRKLEEEAVDEAIKELLARDRGRKLVWWLLTITEHGQSAFTGNALTTSFNCGVQNVGQQLLARILQVAPDGYLAMLNERNSNERDARPARYGTDDGDAGDEDGSDN